VNDDELRAALAEDPDEPPNWPGGLTPEAAFIAQAKDPEGFTELEWHIVSPPSARESPYGECDLGSCAHQPTHYVELLSGQLFFGCIVHCNKLIKMGIVRNKRKFESRV
jgi:hypothetical protein